MLVLSQRGIYTYPYTRSLPRSKQRGNHCFMLYIALHAGTDRSSCWDPWGPGSGTSDPPATSMDSPTPWTALGLWPSCGTLRWWGAAVSLACTAATLFRTGPIGQSPSHMAASQSQWQTCRHVKIIIENRDYNIYFPRDASLWGNGNARASEFRDRSSIPARGEGFSEAATLSPSR